MSAFRTAISAVILSSAAIAPAPGPSAQTSISATPWTELHASRVRLVAGRAKSAKGQYFAGLEIVMDDGWKTYWRMPGDSGVPPTFDWAGSANVASTKVLYPAPMRMPEAGGVAIGYKQSVLLPIEITPQDPCKPVVLKLALEFGVCREICIPATANFDLSIPAAPAGAPAPQIAAALERVPRPQAEPAQRRPRAAARCGEPRRPLAEAHHRGLVCGRCGTAPTFSSRRPRASTCRCRNEWRRMPAASFASSRPGARSCPGPQGQDADAHARQRGRRHRGAVDFSVSHAR